jgi:glycosyltransferase involved in cell wall biosynthesis
MKRRLLICTPTYSLHGGVERILESLADGLPRRGFDVVFGLARGTRFHDPDRFRAEFPRIDSVEIDGTSGRPGDRIRAMRRVIERVDPDVALAARLFDVYPAAAALKLRGHRLRLAVTIQAYEAEYIADAVRYAPFLDLCVTSGRLIANAVVHFDALPAERIVSIPGGVAPPLRRRETRPSQPLRLGYVGRIETLQKRALDLADLLAELRARGVAFTCDVVGTGSAEDELRRRLGSDATVHGWLSTRELYERIYPELDVLLHFAEFEGITIAPREAMAHGVVPVVSRFVGLKTEGEFVDGVNALTFPVGDIARAADAVERLDRDRALLERLSAAAAESQGGIRSEEGALDGWSEALQRTIELPQRSAKSAPAWPREHGRLDFLPRPVADWIRRRWPMIHADPGSEWPHRGPDADPKLLEAIRDFARAAE